MSLEPEMAVVASDIFRHRTVDVWPRSVWRQALRTKLENLPAKINNLIVRVKGLPRLQVPNAHISIASAADQNVIPWNHSPDSHDMALQRAQRISFSIEYVNPGIIKSHDDVL